MPKIRITVSSLGKAVGPALARLHDIQPVGRKIVRIVREQVGKEFAAEAWFSPSGVKVPWRPALPLGPEPERGGDRKTLIGTGRLYEALVGRGPESFARITRRRVEVGATVPYGQTLRGGEGARIRRSPIRIKAKKLAKGSRKGPGKYAMFWALGLGSGLWLTEEKLRSGVLLHPRPHLTNHPELRKRVGRVLRNYIAKGQK